MESGVRRVKSASSFLFLLLFLGIWNCAGSSEKGEEEGSSNGNSGTKSEKSEEGPSEGEALYVQHCGSCHQRDGSGVPGMYPPLKGTETVKGDKVKLIRIVLEGMEGPIEVKGQRYDQAMPAQAQLSNEEIAGILTYIREELGNGASEVAAKEVENERENAEEGR